MAARGAQVTGLDLSSEALDAANAHATESGLVIDYQRMTVEEHLIKNPGKTYDAVICMELLEHVPNPASLVQTCAALSQGLLFFQPLIEPLKPICKQL